MSSKMWLLLVRNVLLMLALQPNQTIRVPARCASKLGLYTKPVFLVFFAFYITHLNFVFLTKHEFYLTFTAKMFEGWEVQKKINICFARKSWLNQRLFHLVLLVSLIIVYYHKIYKLFNAYICIAIK